nr:hypothetical protein [Streptomyces sp. TLI_235]
MGVPEKKVERDIPFAPEAVADLRTWAAAVLEKWTSTTWSSPPS